MVVFYSKIIRNRLAMINKRILLIDSFVISKKPKTLSNIDRNKDCLFQNNLKIKDYFPK
jgi:hypothetical protein